MVHRFRRKFTRPPAGSSPGTLAPAANASPTTVSAYRFDAKECVLLKDPDPAALAQARESGRVLWVNADGHADTSRLSALAELFGIHPLALEGAVNLGQRAKTESYPDTLLILTHMFRGTHPLESEQVSLFMGPGWVFTIQERPGDCLDPVRARLQESGGRLRTRGSDYLAYAILDAIVEEGFPVLEAYGDRLDAMENDILRDPRPGLLLDLQHVKRDLGAVRRQVWPLRDAIGTLTRDESGLIEERSAPYFRDCHDHALRLIDIVESERELASGLMDAYMSAVGNRMNEVMKVLTVIATIFMPLGFIAGVYGMNFDSASPWNMPELRWPYGYLFALGLMAGSALVMVLFFRRRRWL